VIVTLRDRSQSARGAGRSWLDRHYGLAPDWRGVANPGVLHLLKSMIPPGTGPGIT
jgi:hypothetical protein